MQHLLLSKHFGEFVYQYSFTLPNIIPPPLKKIAIC